MPHRKFRADLLALLAYFLLTLLLTYPLILNFTTHVAGDGSDDPALAWNLWWVPHALLDLGVSPIYTNYMFFPIGLNLGFYTLTYLNAFLAIPIQFAFGLIPAANLNLILSFTLSGFGTYLLISYLLRRWLSPSPAAQASIILPASAFAAGLVYAFSANKFLYASLGQFNIASSQWIPFYILFLVKICDSSRPPLRYGFLLGLFLLAQALSELIFASFLILFTFAYLIYWLFTKRHSLRDTRYAIRDLLFALLVFLLPMSPILLALLADTAGEGDFIQQGLGFSNIFSADLLGFFIPSHLHPLFGALESQFHFPYLNFMYLGFAALAVAVVALVKIKPARIWGLWFALIALLTLGPTLRLNGAETDLPLPFDLLLDLPLIKGNRYPSRWSVMLTLCLAILVGYGIAYCLSRLANRKSSSICVRRTPRPRSSVFRPAFLFFAGFCLLFLFEHLSVPLPVSNFQTPDIYFQIARDPGTFSVMELPLAWRNGFRVTGSYRQDSQTLPDRIFMFAQWYQTTQQHPILNGNTSRNPELKFQYFSEAPVLNSLIAIQTGHEVSAETRARDRELAPRVLQFFGTRYLIWHTPFEDENRAVADRTRAYVEENFPVTKISESYENGRGTVVYRVNGAAPPDSLVLRPRDPLARLYLGEGWSALRGEKFWAQRNQAKLFLPLDAARNLTLTLNDFTPYPSSGQGLAVRVNGNQVAHYNPIPLTNGALSIPLPGSALQSGINEIEFDFDKTLPVKDLPPAPPSIVVRSAGEEQGAFGHIYVNGVDESPNQRGYNVVVIEPRTGHVQARANFDTFLNAVESARMARFFENIAEGDLVVVAASDEASNALTSLGVDALRSIGARQDLRGKFRWSHAIIGVKGAPPGSASELSSETNVSQVTLNTPLTEPNVAASIGEIRIEPAP